MYISQIVQNERRHCKNQTQNPNYLFSETIETIKIPDFSSFLDELFDFTCSQSIYLLIYNCEKKSGKNKPKKKSEKKNAKPRA